MAVESNILNEVVLGEESTYGTAPGTFTEAFGAIESFSYTENESIEEIGAIGSGATPLTHEPGLYWVSGQLVTRPTKSSLPVILKAVLGARVDATDYTITDDAATVLSYAARVHYNAANIGEITGLVFTNATLDVAKDGQMTLSLDYIAKKLEIKAGSASYTQPTDSIFTWLDVCGSYGGVNFIGNNISVTWDWNISESEGRGLECQVAGQRRLIQRVTKNNLSLSGSIDVDIDGTFQELGYVDDPTKKNLVVTMERGTDNQHVLTLTNCLLDNKSVEATTDNGIKNMTADVAGATDISIAGDL